jgi:UDP-GlcNAc3NAcA epimerase
MKIVTVLGARPQFVKAAAVSRVMAETPGMQEVIVHTGQHFDNNMSQIFFDQLAIPKPDHHLHIHGLSHGAMTGRMLEAIEGLLLQERPDAVMVYGDTNSTLAGSLSAVKLGIPVAHVEAGLRSFNPRMPEEINRVLTDRISRYLFCPTDHAVANLRSEGFGVEGYENGFSPEVALVGDVMKDAVLYYSRQAFALPATLAALMDRPYVLCTIHRAENTDVPERLRAIFEALNGISAFCRIILPLHPRTVAFLKQYDIALSEEVRLIEPQGYLEMLKLIEGSTMVMTDSGGLQKEAFFFHKFCITLRDETEWLELVEGGYNCLAGADKDRITLAFLENRDKVIGDAPLYGNGDASEKIVKMLSLG